MLSPSEKNGHHKETPKSKHRQSLQSPQSPEQLCAVSRLKPIVRKPARSTITRAASAVLALGYATASGL
ncbi:MAG: hypothetical protein ACKO15_09700, partial [Burkholderiales bacterium]